MRTALHILLAVALGAAAMSGAGAEDLAGYSGAELYRSYCASCHGVEAQGDGPVASSLRVEVPDLTRIAHRHGGRFPADQVRRIIDGRTTLPPHGTRTMPVWGQAFRAAGAEGSQTAAQPDRLIELLVEYLRSIQRD
jgi:mono/diheme cytochrome c family protein